MGPGFEALFETMIEVDTAERAGDAADALRLMAARPLDQDGRPFWRACRVERLAQAVMLGPDLPAWAVSRWLVAQTHGDMGTPRDRRRRRAEAIAVAALGGLDAWSGSGQSSMSQSSMSQSSMSRRDALCTLVDHDWTYRQIYTYELGGLSRFLHGYAAPELVARADHIHDWARAPMCGLRLVERHPGSTTWERVDTRERIVTANLGSAALVADGQHALGRLVPVEGGVMLEGTPLVVPQSVAEQVAADPGSWVRAIAEARHEIETGGFETGLVNDVRGSVWRLMLLNPSSPQPGAAELDSHLARRALEVARLCLDEGWSPAADEVDLWSCLRAALLAPAVVKAIPSVAGTDDLEVLERLARLLAAPADFVCRELLRQLRTAAR
jgi:hypothetical protein